MPRPPKYATAKEAAENNLYSKMGGAEKTGLSLEEFITVATSRCYICGSEPTETLTVDRMDSWHMLSWNYVSHGQPQCGMCKRLAKNYGIKQILKHSARIMAKRMHDKRKLARNKAAIEDALDNWAK